MNIKKIAIKNVKSFGKEVTIGFNEDLNIFIGPNAGGKSNLMDILNIALAYFFIHSWRIRTEFDETGGVRKKYFEERHTIFDPINRLLEKHLKKQEENQQINVVFVPEKEDIENIKNVIDSQEKLIVFEKNEYGSALLKNEFLSQFGQFDINSLIKKELEFIIDNNNPIQISSIASENKIFFNYLRFFNFLNLLIESYNRDAKEDVKKIPDLYPPIAYFSPYRVSQARSLTVTISSTDYFDLLERYAKSDSRSISSTFEVANYYFAKKLRYLNDDITKFKSEEEINFIKEYIKKLGYKDFGYECKNKEKNIYEGFLLKSDGTQLDLSRASGGEKEILNFLLGVFALNVKNGVFIIDEPELHLHPRWQQVLLELFSDFTKNRGIQFFIVTHSPHFVTPRSIKSIFRVYSKNGESQVVAPQILNENDKELFMLVNIFNNTKMFFADKVILVEGDIDQIIYGSILEKTQIKKKDSVVIEIINVQQTGGAKKNKEFLKKWQIKSYGIFDKDKESELQGLQKVHILKNGKIEDYFQNVVKKKKYKIGDAIKIAKHIKESNVEIPSELKGIFKKILKD
ncbi:MAG: AAA family ATPase [Candidatus Cloacimonetes bacterium]|nr:AAA family ATPase [Candidatus Cloacimonadota bacterium]